MGTVLGCAFSSNLEHLLTELNRVDLKLRLQVLEAHSRDKFWNGDELRGLYVSEEEVSALTANGFTCEQKDIPPASGNPSYQSLREELAQLEKQIDERKAGSLCQGTELRLEWLGDRFALTSLDKDILLLCLLPELDLKYERLFGYIQDDVTKRRPTVALALDLLCSSFADRLAERQSLSQHAPLIKYHYISLHDDTPEKNAPLLAKSLKLDDRIRDYLLGFDEIDTNLLLFVHRIAPQRRLEDIVLADNISARLVHLTDAYKGGTHLIYYFYGPEGTGKQSTAEALCHRLRTSLLVADVKLMLRVGLPFETITRLLCREAMLQDAIIYWKGFDTLLDDDFSLQLRTAMAEIEHYPGLVFLSGDRVWDARHSWQSRLFIPVEFPVPDYGQRQQLWLTFLDGQAKAAETVIGVLASKFQLNGGQILEAASLARNLALWRDGGSATGDDLHRACRQVSNQKLIQLARKVKPRHIWADIVLPKDQLEQLRDICSYVKYHQLVYGEWGFERKLSLGKGLNVLFTGPSGTGKTMAAEIMAKELELDLYKVDLATVVSKYIGETEKNLDRIFKEAQNSNAILFFDEADAIFGKRSEVKDSHDRYANIEISYLLQKMEEYEGMVILATNLRKNLDEAFIRRTHFIVEFPSPEEEHRYRIWKNIFPGEAPLEDGVDFEFLARQFKVNGGNIKNIALNAAFLAADDGGMINMKHLIWATKRELQKMGRIHTEADFGKYHAFVTNG
jgi:ATP-dependent 26S proteasome regulatory subunit